MTEEQKRKLASVAMAKFNFKVSSFSIRELVYAPLGHIDEVEESLFPSYSIYKDGKLFNVNRNYFETKRLIFINTFTSRSDIIINENGKINMI